MENKNVYIVIPVYNGQRTLPYVILDIRRFIKNAKIIVVNDGSNDATAEVAQKLNVIYVEHFGNQGKGAALKSGFARALNLGADCVVTMDADGQHEAADVNRLLYKLHTDALDLVIGSRMSEVSQMPIVRVLSNKLTSKLISWRIGQKILDSQSGLRAHKASLLSSLALRTNRFELETELIIKAALDDYRIGSIDVNTIYLKDGRSAISVGDVFNFLGILARSLFW